MLRLHLTMLLRCGLTKHTLSCAQTRSTVLNARSVARSSPLYRGLQQQPCCRPPALCVVCRAREVSPSASRSSRAMADQGQQQAAKRARPQPAAEDATAPVEGDGRRGKRQKGQSNEQLRYLTWALQQACKLGAAKEALHLFNKLAAAHEQLGIPLDANLYTVLLHVLNSGWKWELHVRKAFLARHAGADEAALETAAAKFEQGVVQLAQEMYEAAAAEAQQTGTTVVSQPQVAGDERLLGEMPIGLFCQIVKPVDMASGDVQRQKKGRESQPAQPPQKQKQQQQKLALSPQEQQQLLLQKLARSPQQLQQQHQKQKQQSSGAGAGQEGQEGQGGDPLAALMAHMEHNAKSWAQQRPVIEAALQDLPSGPLTPQQQQEQVAAVVRGVLQLPAARMDESMYVQAARAAALAGDSDRVADLTQQFVDAWRASNGTNAKLAPRLRTFHPALLQYALQGQVDKALSLVELMDGLQQEVLELTESEYALLLEAVSRGGTYQQLVALLTRIQRQLSSLRPATLHLIQQFFISERAAAALAPSGELEGGERRRWVVEEVEVEEDGSCAAAGGKLQLFDLEDNDWGPFLESVKQLALKMQGKAGNFEHFMSWLEKAKGSKQHTIAIDAANISLYGENWEQGSFNFNKVIHIYEALQQQYPKARILVVLHYGRYMQHLKSAGPSPMLHWADALKVKGNLYLSHAGSNDDWYWLYAVVAAGEQGLLVSNDQLRDHVWSLLRAKHFLKWRERHICNFDFPRNPDMSYSFDQPILLPPKPFTGCVQELSPGVWMLPSTNGKWLCARPAGATA